MTQAHIIKTFDILLVGAGLVGTSVLVGLAEAGFRIAVLEHHLPDMMSTSQEDLRPISLAYGSQQQLQAWGVWSALAEHASPINRVHVSEAGCFGRLLFRASEYQVPALGYVVPFSLLQKTLYKKAAEHKHLQFIATEDISDIVYDDNTVTVVYRNAEGERRLNTRLLIAADGTQSRCRDLLQIKTQHNRRDEEAVIASIQLSQPHDYTAYERMTAHGAFAVLPLLNETHCRVVWTRSTLEDHLPVPDAVEQVFADRLGLLRSVEEEAHFPLHATVANDSIRPRCVLLGNAAHTIYPLAAQGFNLGLQDAAVLARLLLRAKQAGEDWGAYAVLERYKVLRAASQKRVIRLTQLLSATSAWSSGLGRHVRGTALLGLDTFPYVKDFMARVLMHVE